MKSYNFFIPIIFLLISSLVSAQKNVNNDLIIIQKKGGKYQYQNNIYTKNQLRKVIVQDPTAKKIHNRYQSQKGISTVFWCISGGLAVTSYSFFRKAQNEEHDPQIIGALGYSLLNGIGSLVSIGVAGITLGIGNANFDKSIDCFNENVKNKHSLGVVPIQLNLQSTQNGIGLVLNF